MTPKKLLKKLPQKLPNKLIAMLICGSALACASLEKKSLEKKSSETKATEQKSPDQKSAASRPAAKATYPGAHNVRTRASATVGMHNKLQRTNENAVGYGGAHYRVVFPDEQHSGMTTLARYHVYRQIKMIYRLDLFKNNTYAVMLSDLMRPHEDHFRNCYTDRLEKNPKLRGSLTLDFELPRKDGVMRNITRTGGQIKDKALIACLTSGLRTVYFAPPRDLHGRLDYVFNVSEPQVSLAK